MSTKKEKEKEIKKEIENITFLFDTSSEANNNDFSNGLDILDLYKLQNDINDAEIGIINNFGINDVFTEMKIYDLNYNVKQLLIICEYYNLLKDVRTNKMKKQEIIEQIIFFENNPENIEIVNKRKELWCYIDELKNDKMMKRFIIWE